MSRLLSLILASVLMVIVGCATPTKTTTQTTPATPGMSMAEAPYDLQFIDNMTMHHQDAVDMAKLAQARAKNPELKSFAAQIIEAQQKEIAQMRQWRDRWYPGRAHSQEMPGMTDSMKAMKELQTTSEFDHKFVDAMIPHHQDAIKMSKEALAKADHPEIKQLAQQIIEAQQREVTRMDRWKVAMHEAE